MDDIIDTHQQQLLTAFTQVLSAEERIASDKAKLAEVTINLKSAIAEAEIELTEAWKQIEQLLSETGEYEALLPGTVTDYKIGWSSPVERVKADPDATPDEFCKIERKPKLKEIGEHLKAIRAEGQPLPNWASFERGEPKLGWKAVKRKANAT